MKLNMFMLTAFVAFLAISQVSADDSGRPMTEQEKIKLQNSKIYIFPSVIEPGSIRPAQPKADGSLPEDNAVPVDPKKETGPQPKEQEKPAEEPVPVEEKPVEPIDQSGNLEVDKLPPIPLINPSILSKFPPFIQSLFGGAADPQQPPMPFVEPEPFLNDLKSESDSSSKNHLMSILFFKSFNNNGDQQNEQNGNKKLLIMKLIPSASDSGDSKETKTQVHLFGGKDDPDNMLNNFYQQQSLFGGDDDIFDHMMLTGNEDSKMNKQDSDEDDDDDDDNDSNEETDSDDSVFSKIRKLFGYSSYSDEKKDCMMMNLMRIRASMYYRTLMHLLFLTGIILLILFIAIMTMRSMRRRRYLRQYNDLRVATIQDETKSLANSEKLMMPPPYEQIIVNDSAVKFMGRNAGQSSLVNSLAQAYKSRSPSSTLTDDNKSLPDYEQVSKSKPDQQEK